MVGNLSDLSPDINPIIEKIKSGQPLKPSEKLDLGEKLFLHILGEESFRELSNLSEEDRNAQFAVFADRHIKSLEPKASPTISKIDLLSNKVIASLENGRRLRQQSLDTLNSFALEGEYRFRKIAEQNVYHAENVKGEKVDSFSFKKLEGDAAGKSHNKVYKVETESGQEVAYFKKGVATIMEGLIPSLADQLGYGDLFVTTALFKTDKGKEGTLQPALLGGDLRHQLPSKPQLLQATLASIVMGMWDAHEKNIRFDSDRNLKFFDNTRSLPHSNEYIMWAGKPRLPYGSALLGLQGSYEPLTKEDLVTIKKCIDHNLQQLPRLEKFLNEASVKAKLSELPKGWLNVGEAMSAMQERLEKMRTALDKGGVQNLRDLVFSAFPSLKWMAALQVIHSFKMAMDSEEGSDLFDLPAQPTLNVELQQAILGGLGGVDASTLVETCVKAVINPKQIKEWTEKLPFDDVMVSISKEINHIYEDPMAEALKNGERNEKNGQDLLSEIKKLAKTDFKDIPLEVIQEYF